jgi:hypothetical protein
LGREEGQLPTGQQRGVGCVGEGEGAAAKQANPRRMRLLLAGWAILHHAQQQEASLPGCGCVVSCLLLFCCCCDGCSGAPRCLSCSCLCARCASHQTHPTLSQQQWASAWWRCGWRLSREGRRSQGVWQLPAWPWLSLWCSWLQQVGGCRLGSAGCATPCTSHADSNSLCVQVCTRLCILHADKHTLHACAGSC